MVSRIGVELDPREVALRPRISGVGRTIEEMRAIKRKMERAGAGAGKSRNIYNKYKRGRK